MNNNKIKIDFKPYIKIIIIFAIILLGFGLIRLNYEMNRYVKGVRTYQLKSDSLKDESYGFLTKYVDYQNFIHSYGIDSELSDNDFKKHVYLYYVVSYDRCSEKILGVSDIENNNNVLNITFDVKSYCNECDFESYIYFIPIDKKNITDNVKFFFDNTNISKCKDYETVDKPILYLYPEREMDVRVYIPNKDSLVTTYPKYHDGWNMHVYPNGDMYDKNGKYYYALYWDEREEHFVSYDEGFYVTKDNAIDFLEEKLSLIGLFLRERNEFIMYWLPKLESNKKSLVYFELTQEVDSYQPLVIYPKPDSILRVIMHVKRVNHKVDIKEQKLESFNRKGFVAVEWGGSIDS